MGTGRASVKREVNEAGDPEIEAALQESERLAAAGDADGALFVLGRVDRVELSDPRVPFRVGDLLYERGRYTEAAENYLRAIQQDGSRALVYFNLGLAFKAGGQRHRAVYAFEQAALRTPDSSMLQQRADWEIFKLTFASVEEAGFADASEDDDFDHLTENAQVEFGLGVSRLAWWARIGSRFLPYRDDFVVRWIGPSGGVAQQDGAQDHGGNLVGSEFEPDDSEALAAGPWAVELVLNDDILDRRTVTIRAQPEGAGGPM
jgi:tetratricopeptide (TPR) repeat protein